jgi:hypothetical protein
MPHDNNQQRFVDSLPDGIKAMVGHIDYTYRLGLRTVIAFRFHYTHQVVDQGNTNYKSQILQYLRNEVTFQSCL